MRRGCRLTRLSAWAGWAGQAGRTGRPQRCRGVTSCLSCPSSLSCRGGHRRRHQQIGLVPDEVVLAVDGELVVLAHEDRADGARLFAIAAEDTARLVDLIHRGVA